MDIGEVFNNIGNLYSNSTVTTTVVLSVLLVTAVLAIYEFIVYRFVSHRAFYNKAFNVSIAVLPFFIATIILCLQSNIVITLGTIGALAIIRFRTAVKDPVDMLYLLWSVHIGICCGCQLYEVAVLTSIAVTIALVIFDKVSFSKKPFILIAHTRGAKEDAIKHLLNEKTKSYRIKSRNATSRGMDYAIELKVRDAGALVESLKSSKDVEKFSLIEYDAEDII